MSQVKLSASFPLTEARIKASFLIVGAYFSSQAKQKKGELRK